MSQKMDTVVILLRVSTCDIHNSYVLLYTVMVCSLLPDGKSHIMTFLSIEAVKTRLALPPEVTAMLVIGRE